MNHWDIAVRTHGANFPQTKHDRANINEVNPRKYWSTDILITSPECTAHSYANGKKKPSKQLSLLDDNTPDPADERSRATMYDVVKFSECHHYNMVMVENVVQAKQWRGFDDWIRDMRNLDYEHHIVYLNSMFAHMRPLDNARIGDFAPQSRDRMYVVFWKRGNKAPDLEFRPLAWCPKCERDVEAVQTWKQTKSVLAHGGRWGRYGAQYVYTCPHCSVPRKWTVLTPYYYAAANAIDWSLPIQRIGDRDDPLQPKTMTRIRSGLDRFVGLHLLIDLSRSHGHDRRSVPLLRSPMQTQTTAQTAALLMLPYTIETLFTSGERLPKGIDEALTTQTSRQSTGVVLPPFMTSVNYFADNTRTVDEPMPTQTTANKMGVVIPPFLLGYANSEGPAKDAVEPLRTIHTENGQALVAPPFMVQLRNHLGAIGIDDALGTFTAGGNHHGLFVPPFLMSYYGSGGSQKTVDEQMGTVTSVDRHALVHPGDQIDVEDCGFRILQPSEIGRGMAFDDEYVVLGTKRDQVRQYGNAVTPPSMERLLERCAATFN